ncbi:integrase [Pseudonocardia spinosispora]|uniref:integrase n=1 Tax=Pseudonocardia spinosispora TaxID=103441 RepID=UPI001B7FD0A4|nr:integrase [Pseudonocardia spinosispora]
MVKRPSVLRVNDQVMFDHTTHTVVAISGATVRLLSATGTTMVIALAYLLAAHDFQLLNTPEHTTDKPTTSPATATGTPTDPTAVKSDGTRVEPHGLLDALPEQVLHAAREWERHLLELETGQPPAHQLPRPEYDPTSSTLAQRERAKAHELSATGTATSVRTIQRMRRRYHEQGLWGLIDSRHLPQTSPPGTPTDAVDARVIAAAKAVIDAQTVTSTGTKSRAIRQIKQRLDDEHGPDTVAMPSRATCYRLLDELSVGKYTFGSATTRRQTANKPSRPYTPTITARPGEQVQLDTTPLDVMAVMDDGVIGRAELVLALDISTRTICAGVLRPVGAKAVDAALLLARVTVPEPMRPGWDQALAMSASRILHSRLVTLDARMAMAAAKPVIVPDTVVIDHGKIFLSEVFQRAADTLGISVQPAHQQTATDEATVERTFASINTLFCQHVAGHTGRDVTRRGSDVNQRAVWSLPELQELFDEWVIAGWQTRPHDGLRHPFNPDHAISPNDAYAAQIAAAGYVPITLTWHDWAGPRPCMRR